MKINTLAPYYPRKIHHQLAKGSEAVLLSPKFLSPCDDFLCDLGQLSDCRVTGGKDRGQGFTTCGSNLVAMSAGHLLQQALSAEEAQ